MTTWVSGRKYATVGMVHPLVVAMWNHAEQIRDDLSKQAAVRGAASMYGWGRGRSHARTLFRVDGKRLGAKAEVLQQ